MKLNLPGLTAHVERGDSLKHHIDPEGSGGWLEFYAADGSQHFRIESHDSLTWRAIAQDCIDIADQQDQADAERASGVGIVGTLRGWFA